MHVCMHFFMCLYVCTYVGTYIFIHICVVVLVWKCTIGANRTPVQKLYFRATCEIAKRLPKIRVMDNGQRNDTKCVRIIGMNDT